MKPSWRPSRWIAAGAAVGAIVVGAGCAGSSGAGGAGRHARAPGRSDLEGITLRTSRVPVPGPAAAEYGAPVEHTPSASEQAVIDALGELPLRHVPALSRMTRQLARAAPDHNTMPPSLVDGLMAWSGLPDPQPQLIVVQMPEDPQGCHRQIGPGCEGAVDSLVRQAESSLRSDGSLLFGVGVVQVPGGATRMVVAVLERTVELARIPVSVPARGAVDVRGRLLGRRTKPRLDVVGPTGDWATREVPLSADGRFSARVPCKDGPGAYQIEILADGVHGPEVAANFPVYCGTEPPSSISMQVEGLDPSVTAEQIARANFLHLNDERRERGLPPLEWSPDAAVVAYAHSRDMAEHDFVGHRSARTGEVLDRFGAAGIEGTVVRENVARGYGPKGIHDSLMGSPGHRVNILATDVTHVGVGVVIGEPEANVPGAPRPVFATQNFYREPGAGAPARNLGPTLRTRVDDRRAREGKPALRWDDGLSTVAQRRAEAKGRGRPPPKGFEKSVFSLGYVSVVSHQLLSPDYDALVGVELWDELAAGAGLGLGVVRTKDEDGRPRFLVVILEAERASR